MFNTYFIIGILLVLLTFFYCGKKYRLPWWKILSFTLLASLAGLLGLRLMSFVEMGTWDGRSFFGVVLFTPILIIPIAFLLRLKPKEALDLCAPGECLTLAEFKVLCITQGCCEGRVLFTDATGQEIRFPSQAVEFITALVLFFVLLCMLRKQKHRGTLYAWFLLLYGVLRFILNWLRETEPFLLGLPAGNFWSLIAILAGSVLLFIDYQHRKASVILDAQLAEKQAAAKALHAVHSAQMAQANKAKK